MENIILDAPLSLPPLGQPWPLGTHYVTITTLEEARRRIGTANVTARQRKSALFYQGIETRQRLPQGMHDRCEEFVFADGNPSTRGLAGLAMHLPLHYKIIRLHDHRVAAGETWDLTVRYEAHWPELDDLEELYVFLHVDHLILEEGARIIVRGNVLAVECGTLERASNPPCLEPVSAELYDFGIFPTPFSVDRNTSSNTGDHGRNGISGFQGAHGTFTRIEGSLFGPYLADLKTGGAAEVDPHGQDGGDGCPGENGSRGHNGGMCRLADIRIGRLVGFEDNPLRVFSQAGTGYPGGDGGQGGNGGHGGNGADFVEAINGTIPAGNGGHGGDGGNGGDGGSGGNGGISSTIFLQMQPADCAHVQTLSLPSVGGSGGCGGVGGLAGVGGNKGKGNGRSEPALPGRDGTPGRNGTDGHPGRSRPGARIFLVKD